MKHGHSFTTCDGTLITDCAECTLNPSGCNHGVKDAICEQAGLFEKLTGVKLRRPGVCGCAYGWLPDGLCARTWREYIKDEKISFDEEPGILRLPHPDVLDSLLSIKRKSEEIF